jgi:AcrR family transcriptional regulator
MTEELAERRSGRAGVDDTALRLFAEHGVAGTSLQMIADAMGVTKAAIYYHYKSKDEIVLGVLAPLLDELPRILERAQARRGRLARADALLIGLVDLVITHGARYHVIMGDPHTAEVMGQQGWVVEWWQHAFEVLAGPEPDPETRVAISMLLTSLQAPFTDPALHAVPSAELREAMLGAGRRLLQLPRRAHPSS